MYGWIYDDGPGWGHRHFSLAELNDNAGEANVEGLAGFGVARGDGGTYTVMNVADEAATFPARPPNGDAATRTAPRSHHTSIPPEPMPGPKPGTRAKHDACETEPAPKSGHRDHRDDNPQNPTSL